MCTSYVEIEYHVSMEMPSLVEHFSWKMFFSWLTIEMHNLNVRFQLFSSHYILFNFWI